MAKQVGPFKIEGQRIGKLVFYKMGDEYYVRTKSSLNRKRVRKDPAFQRTMINAGLLGRASKIGSKIYKSLPANWRKFWMYRSFTGEALLLLRDGMMEDEITALMLKRYVEVKQDNPGQVYKVKEVSKDERFEYKVIDAKQGVKNSKLGITSSKQLQVKAYNTIPFGVTCSKKVSLMGLAYIYARGPNLLVPPSSKPLLNYFDDLSPAKPQFAFSWY